uniref:Uncharacterized protein n=1 Tax=Knipowitschia caucasica TaxID=637954 RepID=A0AAV2M7H6_KNICA
MRGNSGRLQALFCKEEICSEFMRITMKDLLDTFMNALDAYSIRLIKLFRARKAAYHNEMDLLLQVSDSQGLPLLVRDTASKLFRTCLDTDPVESIAKDMKVGIVKVLKDYTGPAVEPTVINIAIVLEEDIVLDELLLMDLFDTSLLPASEESEN